MDKKIVFFDIDGTLLNDKHEIPASTKKAVHALQKKGIYTAIATGRIPSTFDWVLRELNIHSYVSINGQYVVFEGKLIYSNPLDPDTLDALTSFALSQGHVIAYCSDRKIGVTDAEHPIIKQLLDPVQFEYEQADRNFYRTYPVYQNNLFIRKEDEPLYTERFPEYRLIRFNEYGGDLLPKGSSKATGIEKLLQIVGIKNKNCFAFGDGLNDVEMLTTVGVGIAMGNAVREAKAAADYLTSSSSEDGILNGLRMVNLLGV